MQALTGAADTVRPVARERKIHRAKLRYAFIGAQPEAGDHGAAGEFRKAVERGNALVTGARMAVGDTRRLHLAHHQPETITGLLPRPSRNAAAKRVRAFHRA